MNCHQCHLEVKIPGLDAFLCSKCGWVDDLEYAQKKFTQSQEKTKKTRG